MDARHLEGTIEGRQLVSLMSGAASDRIAVDVYPEQGLGIKAAGRIPKGTEVARKGGDGSSSHE